MEDISDENINIQNLQEDERRIYSSIQELKKYLKELNENVCDRREKLDKLQKEIQKANTEKYDLKKQNSLLECQLESTLYHRAMTVNHIDRTRKITKDIADLAHQNENSLNECTLNEQSVGGIQDNLNIMDALLRNKRHRILAAEKSQIIQTKMYTENLQKCHDEYLQLTKQTELAKLDFEALIREYKNAEGNNRNILDAIVQRKNENQAHELQNKEKCRDDFLEKIRMENDNFEHQETKLSSLLDEIKEKIQLKREKNESLEWAINNQATYNSTILKKIKLQQIENETLEKQSKDLHDAITGDEVVMSHSHAQLQEQIMAKSEELKQSENIDTVEATALIALDKEIQPAQDENNEMLKRFEEHDARVLELKAKQNALNETLTAAEQVVSLLTTEVNIMKNDLNEYENIVTSYNTKTSTTMDENVAELNLLLKQMEQARTDEQLKIRSILEEINIVKSMFDSKAVVSLKEYNDQFRKIEDEEKLIENENSKMLTIYVNLEEKLYKSKERGELLQSKIKRQSSLNKVMMSQPTVKSLPTYSKQEPDAGETSASSAENCLSYSQLIKFKNDQRKRQELREQRRMKRMLQNRDKSKDS